MPQEILFDRVNFNVVASFFVFPGTKDQFLREGLNLNWCLKIDPAFSLVRKKQPRKCINAHTTRDEFTPVPVTGSGLLNVVSSFFFNRRANFFHEGVKMGKKVFFSDRRSIRDQKAVHRFISIYCTTDTFWWSNAGGAELVGIFFFAWVRCSLRWFLIGKNVLVTSSPTVNDLQIDQKFTIRFHSCLGINWNRGLMKCRLNPSCTGTALALILLKFYTRSLCTPPFPNSNNWMFETKQKSIYVFHFYQNTMDS